MATYKVEKISGSHKLGEGPHWDADSQTLFYVNSFENTIHKYVPATQKSYVLNLDGSPSIIIPLKGKKDQFVMTIDNKLAIVTWDGESTKPQNVEIIYEADKEPGKETNRFNDGKVDPTGRLWIGTMASVKDDGNFDPERGSLYSFTKDRKVTKHFDKITIANGLAWSADLTQMYYIDTPTNRVDVFDYNATTGEISNRRTCFDLPANGVVGVHPGTAGPDGMTIDTDGNLWVAVFNGACVININPRNGALLRKIEIPSLQVTSVAFGGPNLDELYVVSGRFRFTTEMSQKYPDAGCTFRVTGLGVKGLPGVPAEI